MTTYNDRFISMTRDIDLGNINEAKKLALLDEISAVLTNRIILELLEKTPEEKKSIFIEKISENKDDPDKILLFIDHFVDNADEVIDAEIEKCREDLRAITQNI